MRLPDLKSDAGITPVGIVLCIVLVIVAIWLGAAVHPLLFLLLILALLCLVF